MHDFEKQRFDLTAKEPELSQFISENYNIMTKLFIDPNCIKDWREFKHEQNLDHNKN